MIMGIFGLLLVLLGVIMMDGIGGVVGEEVFDIKIEGIVGLFI